MKIELFSAVLDESIHPDNYRDSPGSAAGFEGEEAPIAIGGSTIRTTIGIEQAGPCGPGANSLFTDYDVVQWERYIIEALPGIIT